MPTAAHAIAATLVAHGVDTAFCLPGEETIDLLEAMDDAGLRLVVTRHEQQAAFLAAAHGRLTGAPALLVTTLGPGATNALTGLAQALLCGWPVVAICGQKPRADNAEGSFQVLDLTGIAAPVTKEVRRLDNPRSAVAAIEDLLATAAAPRPGPVLIEVPEDVAATELDEVPTPQPAFRPAPIVAEPVLERIGERLARASAPVVLVGGGAQDPTVATALERFAEASGVGVLATQMGKGSIPEDAAFSLRALGRNGADTASIAVLDADLVVAVGYHPVEHPPLAWNPTDSTPIVHLDRAPPAVEAGYRPEIVACGDLTDALTRLADLPLGDHGDRTQRLRRAITATLSDEHEPPSFPPTSYDVVSILRSRLDRHDVVALDNGVYKLWFARQYAALAPNTLLLDNALATMGAGLATGVAAARLHPDRRVVAVCGDGGFLMNVQDLGAVLEVPNLTVLVLRDDSYGFIAWHQQEQGADRTAVDLTNPDLVALARSFGLDAIRVDTDDASGGSGLDLGAALETALTADGPVLIDCPLDQRRNEELGDGTVERAGERLSYG